LADIVEKGVEQSAQHGQSEKNIAPQRDRRGEETAISLTTRRGRDKKRPKTTTNNHRSGEAHGKCSPKPLRGKGRGQRKPQKSYLQEKEPVSGRHWIENATEVGASNLRSSLQAKTASSDDGEGGKVKN